MYTLERLQKEIDAYCAQVGLDVDVPVTINKRLRSTYGRVCYLVNNKTKQCTVQSIEFSQTMLNTMTDNFIAGVVRHECGHYITAKKTNSYHGHDDEFRYWCARIGCTDDEMKSAADPEYQQNMVSAPVRHKYDIYCHTCGKVVDYRDRACKLTKYPNTFKCGFCETSRLAIVQNW